MCQQEKIIAWTNGGDVWPERQPGASASRSRRSTRAGKNKIKALTEAKRRMITRVVTGIELRTIFYFGTPQLLLMFARVL